MEFAPANELYHMSCPFQSHTAVSDKAAALKKRQCVFAELMSTEEAYVQDLHEIVNGYVLKLLVQSYTA